MVDRDILLVKTGVIRHHVKRIRNRLPLDAVTLECDEDVRNIVMMDLQQAIQACIDLAVHVCSHDGLGAPEGPASSFALLASHGWIDESLSVRLAGAAGLRNIIVHRYGSLDFVLFSTSLMSGLDDLESFIAALWNRKQD